jgi:hypothetical protein
METFRSHVVRNEKYGPKFNTKQNVNNFNLQQNNTMQSVTFLQSYFQ